MTDDSRELMALAQAGDPDAFAQLYTRHRPMVLALARRSHPRQAEDIAQDTFVRALGALHTWSDQGVGPAAWFRTIVTNLCRDRARSAYEQRVSLGADVGESDVAEPHRSDPALLAERADAGRELCAAVARLSYGQRRVIAAYYLREMPVADIARMYGLKPGSVRVLLHNGRRALAKRLAVADA